MSDFEAALVNRWSLKKTVRLLDRTPVALNDALVSAIIYGRKDLVLSLLDRGAGINMASNRNGYMTALVQAASKGETNTVSLLLDRGANINMVADKNGLGTALIAAAHKGSTDTVSLLLDRGADINLVGGEYGTALTAAAYMREKDTVSLLLDRGADINLIGSEYGTALAAAAFWGYTEIALLLLDKGADINVVGGEKGSALATAAFNRRIDFVSLLLDRGADINVLGGKYGTALAAAASDGSTGIVLLLLGRGADINLVGGEYGTALTAAAYMREKDTVSMLLDRGADIDLMGGEYGTALAAGISNASKDTTSLLLDRGTDINIVVLFHHEDVLDMGAVPLMLDRGADINIVTNEFGTVLGQAIYRGSTEIALFLLEHGADVMHVGGCYPASGLYPNALDVAYSVGSRASPALAAQLETAAQEAGVIFWPPFPMPYTGVSSYANYHIRAFLPSLMNFSATQFCAGSNITPEQADVPCQELGEEVLRRSLAALVNLNKDTAQAKHQWIENDVCYLVTYNLDFGLAYAAARVAWKHFNEHSSSVISIQRGRWHTHAQVLDEARSKAIETGKDHSSSGVPQEIIISPYSIMPRRVWDLKSNRVVDFRMLHASQSTIETKPTFWAVSHSWTNNMSSVWTTINQHQWPVPLPKDITLEYLRSELLTLGAEYVWIDVLCLRQQSEDNSLEQLRQEEWKLDVPTIGNVYRAAANIVRYFNGLGVRFSNEGWDDPQHWLQRAWTLQEIADENTTINGGIPRNRGQVLLNSQGRVLGKVLTFRDAIRPVIKLAEQVDSPHGCDVYELAREMTRRHASQPLDKLSGLFYLLRTTKLPCYDATKTSEDMWRQCFHLLPSERKAEILLNFPYRGSNEQWFPTWAQILDWPVRNPRCDHKRPQSLPDLTTISRDESFFISNIWTIPNAILKEADNPGEYEVQISNSLFGFYPPYLTQEPIDLRDPVFTLAIADLGYAHNWAVCKATDKSQWTDINLGVAEFKVLKKVGVIRTDSCSELSVGGLLQKMDCLFV